MLAASGDLSLGTNLFGATRCVRYEILGGYGVTSLSAMLSAASKPATGSLNDFYGYSAETIPSAPSGVNTVMDFVIKANWTDESGDEDGFRIQWSIDGGPYGNTHTVAANSVTATFPGNCVEGNNYRCRVQSYNGAGNSSYIVSSNQATGDGNCPF